MLIENKVCKIDGRNINTDIVEFVSLNEFYQYINQTPINNAFERRSGYLGSNDDDYSFTKTHNFEEAIQLFKEGWTEMATILQKRIKTKEQQQQLGVQPRNMLGVAGYQAIVPLYLNGVPNNMVSKKMVPVKHKVITINKSINYNAGITVEQIIEESVESLRIVKKLEAQGCRVNLNLVLSTYEDVAVCVKVRLKSANERLNISKLSFPLVHPSMLRRLFFRFIETYPSVTSDFTFGYGRPAPDRCFYDMFNKEYTLPAFVSKMPQIDNVEDLKKI